VLEHIQRFYASINQSASLTFSLRSDAEPAEIVAEVSGRMSKWFHEVTGHIVLERAVVAMEVVELRRRLRKHGEKA
jgi:hypothetical protein